MYIVQVFYTANVTGSLQVFPVVGKPCNVYRFWGNPIIIMGFPHNL